jgi:hypothetical protein
LAAKNAAIIQPALATFRLSSSLAAWLSRLPLAVCSLKQAGLRGAMEFQQLGHSPIELKEVDRELEGFDHARLLGERKIRRVVDGVTSVSTWPVKGVEMRARARERRIGVME